MHGKKKAATGGEEAKVQLFNRRKRGGVWKEKAQRRKNPRGKFYLSGKWIKFQTSEGEDLSLKKRLVSGTSQGKKSLIKGRADLIPHGLVKGGGLLLKSNSTSPRRGH